MYTLQIAKKKKKNGIKKIQKKVKYPTVYKTVWQNQLVSGNSGNSAKHHKFSYQRVKLILDFRKPNAVCSQGNKNVVWKVNSTHLLSTFKVPDTILIALARHSHPIWGKCYYCHFLLMSALSILIAHFLDWMIIPPFATLFKKSWPNF